jgi:hypothetical protein
MSSIKIIQVGSDAASRPIRRQMESAIKPKYSQHDAAKKVGSGAARKTLYGLILLS